MNALSESMRLRERGYRNIDLNAYLGLNGKTYNNWKAGKSSSYLKHLEKISDFLNTTPEYLLTGEKRNYSSLTADEEGLIRLFRKLDKKKQKAISYALRVFSE